MTLNERLANLYVGLAMDLNKEYGFIYTKDNDHTKYNTGREINIKFEDMVEEEA